MKTEQEVRDKVKEIRAELSNTEFNQDMLNAALNILHWVLDE